MFLQNCLAEGCSRPSNDKMLRFACLPIVVLLLPATALLAQSKSSSPPARAPASKSLRIPLPAPTVELLANELSGQIAYNNLVKLAGAPWIRDAKEFAETCYETDVIHDMVRRYGIQTTAREKYEGRGTLDYPMEGELWVLEPQRRLVARLDADPALVARGSKTDDVTGELLYLSPAELSGLRKAAETGNAASHAGKIALLWSHPSAEEGKALASAGIRAVVAFNSRERYFDPDQVVYSSGPYGKQAPLAMGLSISWRQWSELLEDLHLGRKVVVRAKARVDEFANRTEAVYSWIPGSEPEAKGLVLTAHLFDGYTKRGANDNMSGCVIELEILRALDQLIKAGQLPRPRRTIHFLWSNEISGTYAFLKQHAGFADGVSACLNMDMVGEGLRKNNAVLRMSQCPSHMPSYLDGLVRSAMDYVWRSNDVIFMAEVRGRPGGQYFPRPMVEKNGSLDAFRFDILPTVGGSDHICFNNSMVGVPAVALIVWPDQWYHADTDTPDKADPTQLKRAAFIGAACAWAAASCSDETVGPLAEAVSDFGYLRMAQREIPRAMARLAGADAEHLAAETTQALRLVACGAGRELEALRTIEEIFSGSDAARSAVDARLRQWDSYARAMETQVVGSAGSRAAQLCVQPPAQPQPDDWQRRQQTVIPAVAPSVRGRQFDLAGHEKYQQAVKASPELLKKLGLSRQQSTAILNYVNGRRSVAEICDCVAAELDEDVPRQAVADYLEFLRSVDWLVVTTGAR